MDSTSSQIASALKTLRKDRGWSLDKAAQETGVSKAMLGQIEREESSPTIATLWKIATGFKTSFSSFIETRSESMRLESPETLHRTAQAQEINSSGTKLSVTSIFPYDKKLKCEIFKIEFPAKYEHLSLPHPGVIEDILVIEGTIEILVEDVWKSVQKGEGLRFNADKNHGYRNASAEKACVHNILHYA